MIMKIIQHRRKLRKLPEHEEVENQPQPQTDSGRNSNRNGEQRRRTDTAETVEPIVEEEPTVEEPQPKQLNRLRRTAGS